jgi:hypothetical protein
MVYNINSSCQKIVIGSNSSVPLDSQVDEILEERLKSTLIHFYTIVINALIIIIKIDPNSNNNSSFCIEKFIVTTH